MTAEGANAGGRPSVLTPEVRRKLLSGLRCGLSRAAAATRAGIGARTLREWMARTDTAEPYASLRAEIEAVEADCEARLSAVVFKAALADPNQARWLLERRFPQTWGRRTVVVDETPPRPKSLVETFAERIAARQAAKQGAGGGEAAG
jgi:hypothetical protein